MAPLVWLVTGSSTGFGAAFVKAILARGDKVVASSRSLPTLSAAKDLGAHPLELDVAAPPSEIKAKVDEAVKVYGRVDVLIANAGIVQFGPIEEIRYDLLSPCSEQA